ncbi:HAMP domain-containing protein [Lutibacter sp. B2]|nr:HAMP domain-containing protein [Lutibacter sp. B2]
MKKKILMTYVILLIIGTFVTGVISMTFVKNIYINSLEEKLITNSNLIIDTLITKQNNNKQINYFNLAQKFAKKSRTRITFINDKGKVIADSYNNSNIFENYSNKPEVKMAIRGELRSIQRISSMTKKSSLYIANPPVKINDENLIVRLSASIEEIDRLTKSFIKYTFVAIFFGIMISFFIGYYHIDYMLRPIKKLTRASKLIAKGQFDERVEVSTKDEIGELADSFNKMACKVETMITDMRKLENLRKDFVSNVSHELRTPLTSISGFVETLKSWTTINEADRNKILDIIEFETERLKRLINDILKLSEIENVKLLKEKTKIDIHKSMKEIMYILEPIAKNKSITLEVDISEKINHIVGNIDWFKQMIINLCENAIKYTAEGGKVIVKAYSKEKYLFISIKDNGIGIQKEDIPRVFERFYRVEKARSRNMGGTGLGLAIVKHIVMEFNGEIQLKSHVGVGSEFIIKIPL